MKAATHDSFYLPLRQVFQSTPPVKAATADYGIARKPASFQSTPPVKAATAGLEDKMRVYIISIHAAREGGDDRCMGAAAARIISIHAAREGGDLDGLTFAELSEISIHAAREGGDNSSVAVDAASARFQSTPPVKAATLTQRHNQRYRRHFNPRRP